MSNVLQSILESAETRHHQGDDTPEFLLVVMHQAAEDLQLARLTLWTSRGTDAAILARIGDESCDENGRESVLAARTGQVRTAVSAATSAGGRRRLLVASLLIDELRLVLDVTEREHHVEDDVLIQLADVFADLQRRRLLEWHVRHSDSERSLNQLIAQLHSSLDDEIVAGSLATDGAAVLDCRRVAVARRVGRRRWEVVATTGVSQPNLRADATRQICTWIEAAEAGNLKDADAPIVRPLATSKQWNDAAWAAVFEHSDASGDPVPSQLERICGHAALAFANCETLAASSVTGQIRRACRVLTRPRPLVLLAATVVVVLALCLVNTELRIEVYGELAPTQRAYVFAPDDGTIIEVSIDDGSDVSAGVELCTLKNEDLEVQQEAIDGELAAAHARLQAIDAMRGDRVTNTDSMLSAEQVELQKKMASLTRQSQIVSERTSKLNVESRIDGRVYGDRLRQLLLQRPVQRGQFLFEVADPHSGWQLELRVPEADARHVLRAITSSESALPVTFSLETSPEKIRETHLASLAASTDVDESGKLSTLAIAHVNGPEFETERPGTGVVAYVHCGRFSAGYVWFRKVIEFVQRHTRL